ncbi:MAG TPA: phosphoribosylpyrophosphate synthetase [Cyclobacteriaceae bacterium]|nr:phosphoribosylpyrophosphate synthetase [Cyclobacteriaceae bacterium]
MRTYDTLSEAIRDLRKRGFTEDFNLRPHCLQCTSRDLHVHPEDFTVEEFYRFEGMSDPDDNSVLFAISSIEGFKGTLVDAYGVYADNLTPEMTVRLKLRHDN